MHAKPKSPAATAIRRLEKFLAVAAICIAGISFVGMFLVVLAAIVMRFILETPFFWGEEAARYLMLVGVYFGMSVAVKEKAHLGVDIFVNLLPGRAGAAVRLLALALTTLTYIAVTKVCWDFAARMYRGTQTSPAMSIPMWIVYSVLLIGFALCVLESAIRTGEEFFRSGSANTQPADDGTDTEEVRLL